MGNMRAADDTLDHKSDIDMPWYYKEYETHACFARPSWYHKEYDIHTCFARPPDVANRAIAFRWPSLTDFIMDPPQKIQAAHPSNSSATVPSTAVV